MTLSTLLRIKERNTDHDKRFILQNNHYTATNTIANWFEKHELTTTSHSINTSLLQALKVSGKCTGFANHTPHSSAQK